jgi:hypothetical protein
MVHRDKTFHLKDGIHDEDQLNKFMADEQQIRDPLDGFQYRYILIPDYQEGKSAVVFKGHHSFVDGMGGAAFCLAMS